MATALDLLMSTNEDINLLSEESDICTIDAKTRTIFVPSTIVVGGVQSDKNAERIKFSCPKIVGDNLDLSKFSVRINFENVSSVDFNVSIKDQYICDDVAVDGENVTFSWLIGRNAARYMGTVRFIVCAVKTDSDSNINVEWNTAIAEVPVLEGIEIDQPQIGQEEKDVINQLLELTKNTSAEAVQNVNSAKEQAIKDIQSVSQPDTTLTVEGGLAEAKATGEAIGSLKEDLDNFVFIDYNLKRITQFDAIRTDNVNVINNGGNSDVGFVNGGMFFEVYVKEGETYQFNTKVSDNNFRYVITNANNNIIASSKDMATELKVKIPKNAHSLLINNNQLLLAQSDCNVFKVESLSSNNDKHIYYSTDLPNGIESMIGDGQTDNTRQLQAILNYMANNGGGTLIVKDGIYAFNQVPFDKDNYNSIIKIPYVASTSAPPIPINIIGENEIATAYPENVGVPPIENGAIFLITADSTGLENTKLPSFIGAKHTGSETYNNLDYTDITLNLKNLIFRQQQQGVLTDLQLRYVANVNLENIVCDCTGDYSTLTYSGFNTSHGVIMPAINNYGFERIRNLYVIGRGTGLKHSEHLDADNLFFQRCGTGIAVQQSHHASYYGKILVQHCIFAISGDGEARIYNGVLDVELNEGDNYKFINDYSNNLYGDITIHAVFGGIGAKNDLETIYKYVGGADNLVINSEEIPTLSGNSDSEKLESLINILKLKKMIR